jgi:glyceraldehyde 3-phosphate dehydrogenase
VTQEITESNFTDWKVKEEIAESMIPMVGALQRNNDVMVSVYGRQLFNRSVISLLKAHRYVRQVEGEELLVQESFPILEALGKMNLQPAHIDIGKLAVKFKSTAEDVSVEDFLAAEITDVDRGNDAEEPKDIVLYGFGRIGRLLARIMIEKAGSGQGMRLRAIVVRKGKGNDLLKRASLLRRDSVHGSFQGTIQIDEERNALIVNGNYIQIIYSSSPDSVDYTQYGIDNAVVVDNTGIWRDEDGLGLHLKAKGVSKVLLTAPGKGDIKNIVYGVNSCDIESSDKILSAASCTTNAITPVLKLMDEAYGIENGHVETVHSYTNDQNLIDNYHAGDRRGRSAALNMVLTETGAASAVAKAFPALKGKLTGNAIRVPTPNVSMAILSLNLKKGVELQEVNDYLRNAALHSSLQKQVDFVNSPEVVSSDFVGNRAAGIVDAEATIVSGDRCNLYVWYDNEFGYSCQVVRIMQQMTGTQYPSYPIPA